MSIKKRKIGLGIFCTGLTSGSLIYLNQAWYKEYKTSQFHTFNDNKEWLQLDKCGHILSNFQIGSIMMDAMEWAGYKKKNQILIGGLSGFAYMCAIEIMDGYSEGWGFSWGDMSANTLGTGLAICQKAFWNEQRIKLKFTYYTSPFVKYNPNLLGNTLTTQFLKDYNGQIYWISVNPSSFIKKDSKFPKWINFALGYGANGMIGANYNNLIIENGTITTFNRYRQYYFSLDIDLTHIKTKSKVLKFIFYGLNIIKLPFPNIELSERKLKFNYY